VTKRTTRPCRQCGTDYMPYRGQRFCSTSCRFLAKVDKTEDGCWNWTAACISVGYGNFKVPGGHILAHRWAYENLGGRELDAGLVIDHLCRNRRCVNPAHLEQVTNRENCIRGEAPNMRAHRAGACRRGHSLDDAYVDPKSHRRCRACVQVRANKTKESANA